MARYKAGQRVPGQGGWNRGKFKLNCGKCGRQRTPIKVKGRLRYICKPCRIQWHKQKRAEVRAELTTSSFIGKPCRVCGCTRRTTSYGHKCTACRDRRSAEWREAHIDLVNARTRARRNLNWPKARLREREYKLYGPRNPKGEWEWLRKNQALLRTVKRLVKAKLHRPPEVFQSLQRELQVRGLILD